MIDLLAKTEAILLDQVYTSKGFSALLAHVRAGEIPPTDAVVFLHTGGMPALYSRGSSWQRAGEKKPRRLVTRKPMCPPRRR